MATMKQGEAWRLIPLLFAAAVLSGLLASGPAEARVGEVLFVRGPVTAQGDAEAFPRFLGRGDEVREGDVITTGSSSHVAVAFVDQGKVTLRPGTVFKVEQYAHDQQRNEGSALLRLFRGGMRTLTGLIGKARPEAYRVSTPVATIGIRGTRFDARLCDSGECETAGGAEGVGRLAFANGQVFAVRGGERRALDRQSSLYEGDVVETAVGAIAVLVFRDDTRVTLQGDSRFVVEKYQYQEQAPAKGSMLFRFVRGGLRVLTGLVARENRDSFRLATPVATIGIRGTGFDGACQGNCFSPPGQEGGEPGEGDGLFLEVWQGGIVLDQEGKKSEVKEGETVFAKSVFTPPKQVPGIPPGLKQKQGPRPDKPEFGRDQVFGEDDGKKAPPDEQGKDPDPKKGDKKGDEKGEKEGDAKKKQLFVKVSEGKITVNSDDGELEVGAGQSARAAPGQPPQTIPENLLPVDFMQNVPLPDADPNTQKDMEPCQIR